jgi:hypothetical protein
MSAAKLAYTFLGYLKSNIWTTLAESSWKNIFNKIWKRTHIKTIVFLKSSNSDLYSNIYKFLIAI